jgi:hypothetical protein
LNIIFACRRLGSIEADQELLDRLTNFPAQKEALFRATAQGIRTGGTEKLNDLGRRLEEADDRALGTC